MDPMSEMLEGVRLRSFVHGRNEFRAPWGFRVPGTDEPIPPGGAPPHDFMPVPSRDAGRTPALPGGGFYAVTRGSCWMEVEGEDRKLELHAGDVAILTQGGAHQLRDDLKSDVKPIWEVVPAEHFRLRGGVSYGGSGAATGLITGGFFFEDRADHRLPSALPPVIHIKGSSGEGDPWLKPLLDVLAHETDEYGDGAQAVINHLATALFMQAVRLHAKRESAETSTGSLTALLDPEIGPALAQMHARPEEAWTVASLADAVAMSRSGFAARFTSLVGTPPLQYLAAYRMRRAAELLRVGRFTARQVAAKVGYESEAAFSNAFKRKYGVAPAAYRRGHAAEDGQRRRA
jgi:AraC-like DNA-binding protein